MIQSQIFVQHDAGRFFADIALCYRSQLLSRGTFWSFEVGEGPFDALDGFEDQVL